jgi:glutamate-1-semialdehyde aminotransferase
LPSVEVEGNGNPRWGEEVKKDGAAGWKLSLPTDLEVAVAKRIVDAARQLGVDVV